jgi:hypothetical protein
MILPLRYLLATIAVCFISLGSASHALCIYDGKLDEKTTLEQEFRDVSLVVKAEVLSSRVIAIPGPEEDTGILYRIRVSQSFKGKAPTVLSYYSRRDSGGFYLDARTGYLLFLDPISLSEWAQDAPGATVVNYNCGQSRAWAGVSRSDREKLQALSAGYASTGAKK